MKKVRTRYAPSPTGNLHIGGARTALFCYLFAKHYGGDFIVRIEDTDQLRNVAKAEEYQLDNLAWLGISADESPQKPNAKFGPYRQSEKLTRYQQIIDLLIQKGHAYYAYDTIEELEKQRAAQIERGLYSFRYDKKWLKLTKAEQKLRHDAGHYVVRLALQAGKTYQWKDLVRGPIQVAAEEIGDFVIQKEDRFPTYNLAVTVDDHDMQISHVLRGEEHITNTPKQLALYEALGWAPPEFAHLTIITNLEGKKLSKRDLSTHQYIEDYRHENYPPAAIFNFLALLGWSHPNKQELLSREELIKDFDPGRFSRSPSKFDAQKLDWFAKQYVKRTPNAQLIKKLALQNPPNHEWLNLFVETYKQNCPSYLALKNYFLMYQNPSAEKQKLTGVSQVFAKELARAPFSPEGISQALEKTAAITQARGKDLYLPIRLATTQLKEGPELRNAIFLYGQKIIYKRLGIKKESFSCETCG